MHKAGRHIAYFCMEYGLDETLPIYAGGLGILAGDHIRAARDLNLPLVAIGIMWRQGYTTQLIGENGWPYDTYPEVNPEGLTDTGIRVPLHLRGRKVMVRAWYTDRFGNAPLYLLDTNLPENAYPDRLITSRLYGGNDEDRVLQEMVLGVGGVRLLRTLGLDPAVYHFNEGHAALAGIELIREQMAAGHSFEEALARVRQHVVFTTHTPVPAGNEVHSLQLLEAAGAFLGLSREQMVAIGGDPFGMTVAGLRLSRIANGVSELHGHTSRAMWAGVERAAPIIHITNGVHPGVFQDPRIRAVYTAGGDLWAAHMACKKAMIEEVGRRTGIWLNPDVLTIGFARRAAPYKRPDLIFHYPDRTEALLRQGTVQVIFAGKAHPRDEPAKAVVARLVDWSRRYPGRVVFLQAYNMRLGKTLTRGCDVWLNNPQRPLEASGTSGMKAAMNGVLNLSTLDGWWAEACEHGVNGWQFGDGYTGPNQTEYDAQALHRVLTGEVIPTYYERRADWVAMMRNSIAMSQERYSAHRMVEQYRTEMYKLS